ncbi:CbiX/SirB N-terminal domain-containing protein [Halioxenophilus sp. WMMB6]|uniref:sirohydrochlorin chelatase n=1 Tax=Halioxenophilus sp. WMMB6 TaxID=3073815 RepID=UPI00295E41D5|nr:CbiX/SirB N-terminal domain-containing protein [Halioxenophilus sp. WMMB6]
MSDVDQDKTLLVIAHGSRSTTANDEFRALVASLQSHAIGFSEVEAVFLEIAQPSLEEAVDKHYQRGCKYFVIYPLFFNFGKHVSQDIPKLIDQIQQRFDGTTVELLEYFGASSSLPMAMASHITLQTTKGGFDD